MNYPGLDLSKSTWVVIATVSPPEDMVLESLIQSFGIPVRLINESIGSVFGLTIGPLGQVKVAVPEAYAEEAKQLMQAELEKPELEKPEF
ncbi:MAG: hypothetical protein PHZ03_02635 [Syntrophomonas sp.]|nr:hypothetical protein [Syntrophomonas sp.]